MQCSSSHHMHCSIICGQALDRLRLLRAAETVSSTETAETRPAGDWVPVIKPDEFPKGAHVHRCICSGSGGERCRRYGPRTFGTVAPSVLDRQATELLMFRLWTTSPLPWVDGRRSVMCIVQACGRRCVWTASTSCCFGTATTSTPSRPGADGIAHEKTRMLLSAAARACLQAG